MARVYQSGCNIPLRCFLDLWLVLYSALGTDMHMCCQRAFSSCTAPKAPCTEVSVTFIDSLPFYQSNLVPDGSCISSVLCWGNFPIWIEVQSLQCPWPRYKCNLFPSIKIPPPPPKDNFCWISTFLRFLFCFWLSLTFTLSHTHYVQLQSSYHLNSSITPHY